MTTKREQIFEALFTVLSGVSGVRAKRNDVLPERLDNGAEPLLIQQDGKEPPEPEITLSPPEYLYDETIDVEVAVQHATGREGALDAVLANIGTALAADRTLGGLADDCRVIRMPDLKDQAVAGTSSLKVATVTVAIQYTTSDPLA